MLDGEGLGGGEVVLGETTTADVPGLTVQYESVSVCVCVCVRACVCVCV